MWGDLRTGTGVNACKTLVGPKNTRSATPFIVAPRFELPLLGSNQDSPDPESGVLPVTPRGTVPKDDTVGSSGRARLKNQNRGEWGVVPRGAVPNARLAPSRTTPHSLRLCATAAQGEKRRMELRGLEPLTSWVRSRRSPS